MFTELEDRVLWYDGDSSLSEDAIMNLLINGKSIDGIFVDKTSSSIEQYNKFVGIDERILEKKELKAVFNFDWNIPNDYKQLDVETYVFERLYDEIDVLGHTIDSDNLTVLSRIERTKYELSRYKKRNFYELLKTIIYIINNLRNNGVVWGVGRGSSVSSYVLYLIGVHDVDSVKYELDFSEFLRDS